MIDPKYIDPYLVGGFLKRIAWKIIEIPMRAWLHLPEWVRTTVTIVVGLIGAWILYKAWKNRDAWRHVEISD